MEVPLAERIRPQSIDDYIGQSHLMGEHGVLRKIIRADVIPSMIFWGPPGVGKTTLAQLIAKHLDRPIHTLSAISSGVKDVREEIDSAKFQLAHKGVQTLLFIDEVHRFNKAQQDALLPAVEDKLITLVAATTENPAFSIICHRWVIRRLSWVLWSNKLAGSHSRFWVHSHSAP